MKPTRALLHSVDSTAPAGLPCRQQLSTRGWNSALTHVVVFAKLWHRVLLQSNLDKPFFVWGEDALLKWPGAEPALIAERDAFMARVLAATATGTNSNAPAFVSEEVSLRHLTA